MSNMSFEEKLKNLQSIIKKIESNELGLEESMKLYEEGIMLISELEKTLNDANEKYNNLNSQEMIEKVLK